MRAAFGAAALAVALVLSGCGVPGRSTRVTVPFAAAESGFDGDWLGELVLKDGRRVRLSSGRVLGGWVCGDLMLGGSHCLKPDEIASVDYVHTELGRPGPIVILVSAVVVGAPAAIWLANDLEEAREEKRAKEDAYLEAEAVRAAATGTPPLPATDERVARHDAFSHLARCMEWPRVEIERIDGAELVEAVTDGKQRCLNQAIGWLQVTGEDDDRRRLKFIRSARKRYEALICSSRGYSTGLSAPDREDMGSASETWMNEYRAVVADPRTYEFEDGAPCKSDEVERAAALEQALHKFPLTEPYVERKPVIVNRRAP